MSYLETWEKILLGVVVAVFAPMLLAMLWLMFVYLPVTANAEAECLRRGYPKASVTVYLEKYCTTLDGAVRVPVVPLP